MSLWAGKDDTKRLNDFDSTQEILTMSRQITVALLATLSVTAPQMAAAQFEGVIKQRTISVNLAALAARGFDISNLLDVTVEQLLALRGELEALGDMTVTEDDLYIKGNHIRSDFTDDEGPAWASIEAMEIRPKTKRIAVAWFKNP